MILSRYTRKRTVYWWTVLLSIALLCTQGVKLHVHSLEHDHKENLQHSHIDSKTDSSHSHLSDAHLSSDITHSDHHDELVSELDASPAGFLKKVSNSVFTLALLVTFFAFLYAVLFKLIFNRRHVKDSILYWRYLFSPPLRAPPPL